MNFKLTFRWKISDLCRGISDFKKGYQPRTDIVKGEKGDLVADSHSILAKWRNRFYQLLNMMVGRQKYTQQNHLYLSQVPLTLSCLLQS